MQVLVVGGEHAFVQGTFATKLNGVGVGVEAHWDWTIRRPPQNIPKGCDGVVVLHDMVGHHLSNAANTAATAANVPFALIPRKFSAALPILRRSGIVAESVPDEPVDDPTDDVAVPTPPNQPDALRAEIVRALEATFDADDADVAHAVVGTDGAEPFGVVYPMVAKVRRQMVSEWSVHKRSPEAERSLAAAAAAWLGRNPPNTDDPSAISRVRKATQALFGTAVPERVLVGAGFQVWELRALFTRDRVRHGGQAGDGILNGLTPAEFDAFRDWVVDVRDNGKGSVVACPLRRSMRGLPVEGLTMMMRVVPDLEVHQAGVAYQKMTGSGLGPYYHAAVSWYVAAHGWDRTIAEPTPEPTPEPVAPSVEGPTAGILAALFGEGVSPSVQVAIEARAALDAVNAAAESLASGGDTAALDALVRSKAADIVAARDVATLEARALEAKAAYLKAQEEFLAAQGAAEEARTRIAALRRQA